MKHVSTKVVVLMAGACLSMASTAMAGIAGWDLQIQLGSNQPWSSAANPGSSTVTETVRDGKVIYRVTGAWSTANWACNWDFQFDPDPFISSSFTLQNLTGALNPFTVTVMAPAFPALSAPTTMSGSVSGTIGDGDGIVDQFGNGATVLTQVNGRPYYEAMVDGAGVRSLLTAPRSDGTPVGLTRNINLPDPVQEQSDFIGEVGPAVNTTIGIRNAFMLTPGDNASFTSTFLIVPAPGAFGVLGLAGLVAGRRRR